MIIHIVHLYYQKNEGTKSYKNTAKMQDLAAKIHIEMNVNNVNYVNNLTLLWPIGNFQ